MAKFSHLKPVPADPIISVFGEYLQNPNPQKVNLSIGLYFDEAGRIDMLNSVRKAYVKLAEKNILRGYLPIDGNQPFLAEIRKLCYPFVGSSKQLVSGLGKTETFEEFSARVASVQTIAASGGLSIVAQTLATFTDCKKLYCTNPTWSNHHDFFKAQGFNTAEFLHYDPEVMGINFAKTYADLEQKLQKHEAVLFHPVCHNPTGADFNREQWFKVLELVRDRQAIAIFDMAYLGYAEGVTEDLTALEVAYQVLPEFIHIFSCSKTFGIYADRTGAVNFVCETPAEAEVLVSNLKQIVRANYSSPVLNGSEMVRELLSDRQPGGLFDQWQAELGYARNRLINNRKVLAKKLRAHGIDFDYINSQHGFFSFLKVTPEQALKLRNQYAIYILESGRINFAGINDDNIDYIADAIAAVIKE